MTEDNGGYTRDPLIRTFGAVLRAYREAAGLSRPQLAEALGCRPGWIEKLETAQKPPSEATADDLDVYFKCGPARTFWTMWREIRRTGKHLVLPPGFSGFVEQEAKAVAIYGFEAQVIPGLLQREAYARALMDAGQPSDELNDLVAARLSRQAIHEKDKAPRMWFVIDESALHRPVGGPKAMREQLSHLADLATNLSRIHIRVLPYKSVTWAGLDGSFTILELPDRHKVAYLESPGSGCLVNDPDRVGAATVRFQLVMGEALPTDESLNMIMRALEDYP
jgi:transcriptional regulator with XRE-family HTH domain